jgi:hypothetical protein
VYTRTPVSDQVNHGCTPGTRVRDESAKPCQTCGEELLSTNVGELCAECSYIARQEAVAVVQARLNGSGREAS